MAIYRLKVSFTDNPEIYRLIDIKPEDNLERLHRIILKSIKFEEGELAAFYVSYKDKKNQIEIPLTDMDSEETGDLTMKSIQVKEYIRKLNDVLTYIYDFLKMWSFDIMLIKKLDKPTTGTKYPAIIKSVGEAPSQDESDEDIFTETLTEEDLMILSDMMSSKKPFRQKDLDDDDLGIIEQEFLGLNDDDDDDFKDDHYNSSYGRYDDDDY